MKEVLKKIIKKIPIAFTQNQRYDRWTVQILQRYCQKNSNCIDIGCHSGEVLRQILKQAPEGTHFCFEPIPHLYQYLVKHFPDNCQFYDIALSDKKGETTFNYVVSNPAYSGFRQREYARKQEEIRKIEVKAEPLDAIVPTDTPIDIIKVDVEGAELQVLRGGVKTIRRNQPIIVFEHGMGAADFYGTRPEQVFEFLTNECGLRISLLPDFLKKAPALSQKEFVGHFERRTHYYFVAHPRH